MSTLYVSSRAVRLRLCPPRPVRPRGELGCNPYVSQEIEHIAHVPQDDQQSRDASTTRPTGQPPSRTGWFLAIGTAFALLFGLLDILFGNAILLRLLAEPPTPVSDPTDTRTTRTPQLKLLAPGTAFNDCPDCPDLIVVPSGTYDMGSPPDETGRYANEGPVRSRNIPTAISVGVHEVTRGMFRRFVDATGYDTGRSCWTYERQRWADRNGRAWRNPGYDQTDDHPVVCVNWRDAQSYVAWLSSQAGHDYRLLTELEWEYVARAHTTTAYYWGNGNQCAFANAADQRTTLYWQAACDDGHQHTAPKESYPPNAFGLYDTLGNVWEWTADCWTEKYGVPPPDCSMRVLRGGSRHVSSAGVRAAHRYPVDPSSRNQNTGFRVARSNAAPTGPDVTIVPSGHALEHDARPLSAVEATQISDLPSIPRLNRNCDTLVRDINGIPLSAVQDETIAEVVSALLESPPATKAAIICAGRVAKSAEYYPNNDKELARVIDAALTSGFCEEARSLAQSLQYYPNQSQQKAKVAKHCLGSD